MYVFDPDTLLLTDFDNTRQPFYGESFSVPNHSQPSVSSNTNVIIELDTSLLNGMGLQRG